MAEVALEDDRMVERCELRRERARSAKGDVAPDVGEVGDVTVAALGVLGGGDAALADAAAF